MDLGIGQLPIAWGFPPAFLNYPFITTISKSSKEKEERNMAVKKLTKNSARRNSLPLSSGGFMKWIFQNHLMRRLQGDSDIPFGAHFPASLSIPFLVARRLLTNP